MNADLLSRWVVVVGSGGVGKTTVASALALRSAAAGADTLVMTFDPSRRLKDALGVGDAAAGTEVRVDVDSPGRLSASLLDSKTTFDGLVERYAPDAAARDRILGNRYYDQLAGDLAGVLEYMAVERLFEIDAEGRYDRIILDTPPTSQALDFLDAPERVVSFLDSGVLSLALKPWFDARGRLRLVGRLGRLGDGVTRWLDRLVGVELLADMAEFFQAFEPLYAGFRERAERVRELLREPETGFLLVTAPGRGRVADALFFARSLAERNHRLSAVVLNRAHPAAGAREPRGEGEELLAWLAERDLRAAVELEDLLAESCPLWRIPLLAEEPKGLAALAKFARQMKLPPEASS